jgi:peptidylprolyl isomerase
MKFTALIAKSMTKSITIISVLAIAVLIAGCGSKGAELDSVNGAQPTATADSGSTEETSSDSKSEGKTVNPKVSGSLSSKPKISDASGTPPDKLITKDIKEGTGQPAKNGQSVTVNYVGHNWSNNEEFDTSWGKEAFTFTLGDGNVIKGWDQGVVGMKKGGRRLLIIPPDLGYGESGSGSIPANETLIFVVDLKKIE